MIDGFHQALRARIDDLASRKRDAILLGLGNNVEAIALTYKYNTGYLQALEHVIQAAHEVEQILYNPEKGAM